MRTLFWATHPTTTKKRQSYLFSFSIPPHVVHRFIFFSSLHWTFAQQKHRWVSSSLITKWSVLNVIKFSKWINSNGYTKVHHSFEYTHTRIQTHFYIDSARRHTRNPQPQTNKRTKKRFSSVQFVDSFVYVWHHETTSSYISWQFFCRWSSQSHFVFLSLYFHKNLYK